MDNLTDSEIAEKFIAWCEYHRFNQTTMAGLAGRSRAWASLIKKRLPSRLLTETRNNILFLLRASGEI